MAWNVVNNGGIINNIDGDNRIAGSHFGIGNVSHGASMETVDADVESQPCSLYGKTTKLKVCSRLTLDWFEVADFVGVRPHHRARFERGREPYGVWEWLEERGRLADLRAALAELNRLDLVKLLDDDREGMALE